MQMMRCAASVADTFNKTPVVIADKQFLLPGIGSMKSRFPNTTDRREPVSVVRVYLFLLSVKYHNPSTCDIWSFLKKCETPVTVLYNLSQSALFSLHHYPAALSGVFNKGYSYLRSIVFSLVSIVFRHHRVGASQHRETLRALTVGLYPMEKVTGMSFLN